MSDYYGEATLESWLANELFDVDTVPIDIVARFEKWRVGIEGDIESWMNSDDGDGNNLSWRGWGRGFNSIPDEDDVELGEAIRRSINQLKKRQYPDP